MLTCGQKHALHLFSKGHSIFITGPSGTGKTYLLESLYEKTVLSGKKVQICAMTGSASVLLKGASTLHSWSGIGIANGSSDYLSDKVVKKRHNRAKWQCLDVLIIDEVSMMSKKIFELLNDIAQKCRYNSRFFGGIQVVMCGDFFQLPPIGNPNDLGSQDFCFESHLFAINFPPGHCVQLKQNFRQITDPTYTNILNEIRYGKLSQESISVLMNCQKKTAPRSVIRIYSFKNEVSLFNTKTLKKLPGDEHHFSAILPDNSYHGSTASYQEMNNEIDFCIKNFPGEIELILKRNATVMFNVNLDLASDQPICNGSQGTIVGFNNHDGLPVVKLNNGRVVDVQHFRYHSKKFPCIYITQLPLVLAFAISCHKSQGTAISQAQVDIGKTIFAPGQAYVALSRVKSLNGLYLVNFDPSKIIVDKKVMEFYKSNNLCIYKSKRLQMLWCILSTFYLPSQLGSWVGLFSKLPFHLKQKILSFAYTSAWV